MISKKIKIIGIILLLFFIAVVIIALGRSNVSAITEKKEYKKGELLKISIRNRDKENICFSSCYPYYYENKKQGDDWKSFDYVECKDKDSVKTCLESFKTKEFEITLPDNLNSGSYRLAIPICKNCKENEEFKAEKWFYTNNFVLQ